MALFYTLISTQLSPICSYTDSHEPQKDLRFSLLLLLSFTCFCSTFCLERDTITSTYFIKDSETIISNGGTFKLGFFSPSNSHSTRRYVGIWFNQISEKTIVWVANRDNPLNNTSGIFTISKDGNLVVLDGNDTVLWSSNVSSPVINTSARILDTGNLVLQDTTSGEVIWESFKHPSDKFLRYTKLITNKDTDSIDKVQLTSWKNPFDPSPGNFSFGLDVQYLRELVIWNGRNPYWRSGPWNGNYFTGIPDTNSNNLPRFTLVPESKTYTLFIPSNNFDLQDFMFLSLSSEGRVEQKYWNVGKAQWDVSWSTQQTQCDSYGACGAFGICDVKASPICSCLRGFKPKNEAEWNQGNWSRGCVRKTPLNCTHESNDASAETDDGFHKLETIKLPFFEEWSDSSFSGNNCRQECLKNCLCTAYAYEDDIGCILWRRDSLIDIQKFESGGADLYLRLAHADLDHTTNDHVKDKKGITVAIVLPAGMLIIFILIGIYFWLRWNTHRHGKKTTMTSRKKEKILKWTKDDDTVEDEIELEELPLYDFDKLEMATNNFDLSNKLGQGGFGPVYKGKLLHGQEIAIKRLSKASNQGYEEFITEVKVISKLQHRNLVRLLGCCIEGEEKMLIYEYMPNGSLDEMIFGRSSKPTILDWKKRCNIIHGIARGLLYLHRDSRLKIIHRDLKASNILLDKELNPKISDFGTARIFGGDEVVANTIRVVGTYGYMSPEYAMEGQFSEKSDVFSFGVLLLEIISGRRNYDFHEYATSLLGYAWNLWMENNLIPLIEPTIHELCYQSEILRCIHVGLLCVQEFVDDRPNMSTIVSVLNSEIIDLPSPKRPGFVGRSHKSDTAESSQQNLDKYSTISLTQSTGTNSGAPPATITAR